MIGKPVLSFLMFIGYIYLGCSAVFYLFVDNYDKATVYTLALILLMLARIYDQLDHILRNKQK